MSIFPFILPFTTSPWAYIFCLEPGNIDALKMLDLQTKSAITSNILQVQH
jgi:hypothetical protein